MSAPSIEQMIRRVSGRSALRQWEVGVRPGQVVLLDEEGPQPLEVALVAAGPVRVDHLAHRRRLELPMPDERVDVRRPCLERQERLVRLEHQGEIHPEPVLAECQGQVVRGERVRRARLIEARLETAVAREQLAMGRRAHRTHMGHLDHHAPARQDLPEPLGLLDDGRELGERVVELDGDVAARPENAPDLGEYLVSIAESTAHVRFRVVEEEVVDDARVAGQVRNEPCHGCQLVRIGRVGAEEDVRRAQRPVHVPPDVPDEVEDEEAVGLERRGDPESGRRLV
jgi:hypothetical protein